MQYAPDVRQAQPFNCLPEAKSGLYYASGKNQHPGHIYLTTFRSDHVTQVECGLRNAADFTAISGMWY